VSTALKRFLFRFGWEGSQPIAEWMVEAEAVRELAVQLQAALEKERLAAKNRSDAGRRRDELQKQDKTLAGRVNRLDEAQKAFMEK